MKVLKKIPIPGMGMGGMGNARKTKLLKWTYSVTLKFYVKKFHLKMEYHCSHCHLRFNEDTHNLFAKGSKARCKSCDTKRKTKREDWIALCEQNRIKCEICNISSCVISSAIKKNENTTDREDSTVQSSTSKTTNVKVQNQQKSPNYQVVQCEETEDLSAINEFCRELKAKGKSFTDIITDIALYMKTKKSEEEIISTQNILRSSFRKTEAEYHSKIDELTSRLDLVEVEIIESTKSLRDLTETIKPNDIIDMSEKLEYIQETVDDLRSSNDEKIIELKRKLDIETKKTAVMEETLIELLQEKQEKSKQNTVTSELEKSLKLRDDKIKQLEKTVSDHEKTIEYHSKILRALAKKVKLEDDDISDDEE